MNEKELLEEANSERGLHIYMGETEQMKKATELVYQRLIRLEEYNAPIYVYRITRKGKEMLKEFEKVMA